MHGAAQIGERAAEEEPRAARPRALDEAGADEPLGPRQQPHEGETEDDEHEARDLLEQELVAEEAVAEERGADAERDEDRREAEDERDARDDDPPGHPRPPSWSASTAETADR